MIDSKDMVRRLRVLRHQLRGQVIGEQLGVQLYWGVDWQMSHQWIGQLTRPLYVVAQDG